jgi:hypothetical protein
VTKNFDAVEMSRRLREQTSRKLAEMTREERLALLNGYIRKPSKAAAPEETILRERSPAYGRSADE